MPIILCQSPFLLIISIMMCFWSLVCFFSFIISLSFLSITSFHFELFYLIHAFLKFFCSKKHAQGDLSCAFLDYIFFPFFDYTLYLSLFSFLTSSFALSLSLSFYFCFSICLATITFLLILIQLAQLCPLSRQYNVLYMNSPQISSLSKTICLSDLQKTECCFPCTLVTDVTRTWSWRRVNWEKNAQPVSWELSLFKLFIICVAALGLTCGTQAL